MFIHMMEKTDQTVVVKGKRTKRARLISSSSSSHGVDSCNNSQSQATSSTCTVTDREDEDVANCLILLARGVVNSRSHKASSQRNPSRMIYECNTCNRSFPSFQALGGHRASHKKPKTLSTENNKCNGSVGDDRLEDHERKPHGDDDREMSDKAKVHACSICGSEFGSGQALGGHMRRHRSVFKGSNASLEASVNDSSSHVLCEKPINTNNNNNNNNNNNRTINNNVFSLDLNLPAPSEDECSTSKRVFSDATESVVDCHY